MPLGASTENLLGPLTDGSISSHRPPWIAPQMRFGRLSNSIIAQPPVVAVTLFTGVGAILGPGPALAGTGTETFTGTGALAGPNPSIAGTGSVTLSGTGAIVIPGPALAAVGVETFLGTAVIIGPGPAILGSGAFNIILGVIIGPGPTIHGVGLVEHLETSDELDADRWRLMPYYFPRHARGRRSW